MVTSTKNRLSDVLPQAELPISPSSRQTIRAMERARARSAGAAGRSAVTRRHTTPAASVERSRTPEQLRRDRLAAFWMFVVVAAMLSLIAWLASLSPNVSSSATDLWMFW